jgi:RimJ/RimL family protein N-acetyltransferase
LLVKEWHSISSDEFAEKELAGVIVGILTEPVTRSLPVSWQGVYSVERTREWIKERDNEGTTLIIIEKSRRKAAGLMILFETDDENVMGGIEIRLGYLLSEQFWGKGLASELIEGFVRWCRSKSEISAIVGGVALDNPVSKRVLVKNGFRLSNSESKVSKGEEIFRLNLKA